MYVSWVIVDQPSSSIKTDSPPNTNTLVTGYVIVDEQPKGPVKCISEYLARKEGTGLFYVLKVFI